MGRIPELQQSVLPIRKHVGVYLVAQFLGSGDFLVEGNPDSDLANCRWILISIRSISFSLVTQRKLTIVQMNRNKRHTSMASHRNLRATVR